MPVKRRLIFWQDVPSDHQAPLIRQVGTNWNGEVLLVTEWETSQRRLRQGWGQPDFTPAHVIVAPSRAERQHLLKECASQDTIHIFSGIHAYPETYWTFRKAARTSAKLGVFVEPGRHNDGFKALLRRLHYTSHALRWRRRLDFLLVAGELGVQWYRYSGFRANSIFPFGYFVSNADGIVIENNKIDDKKLSNTGQQLLFVGQLIARKGLDLLLRGIADDSTMLWEVHVIGDGPDAPRYQTLAKDLGLVSRVRWYGVLPNKDVRSLMARVDALVLPSRFDGWGAVVNEALLMGTPVVVSDGCGVSDLIHKPCLGKVFCSGSVTSLREALNALAHAGKLSQVNRGRIKGWAASTISPQAGACYLIEILNYVQGIGERPDAPWRMATPSS